MALSRPSPDIALAEPFFHANTHRLRPTEEKPLPCLLWTGRTDENGYGRIAVGSLGNMFVHRYAYHLFFFFMDIEPGQVVGRACELKLCVAQECLLLRAPRAGVRTKLSEKQTDDLLWFLRTFPTRSYPTARLATEFGVSERWVNQLATQHHITRPIEHQSRLEIATDRIMNRSRQ